MILITLFFRAQNISEKLFQRTPEMNRHLNIELLCGPAVHIQVGTFNLMILSKAALLPNLMNCFY